MWLELGYGFLRRCVRWWQFSRRVDFLWLWRRFLVGRGTDSMPSRLSSVAVEIGRLFLTISEGRWELFLLLSSSSYGCVKHDVSLSIHRPSVRAKQATVNRRHYVLGLLAGGDLINPRTDTHRNGTESPNDNDGNEGAVHRAWS